MLYISAHLPDNSDIYDINVEGDNITFYNAVGDSFVFHVDDPHLFNVQLFERVILQTFKDLFDYVKKDTVYINFEDSDKNFTFQSFSTTALDVHVFNDNFHITDIEELLDLTIGDEKGIEVKMTTKEILEIVKKNETEKKY